jgi:hypothetical protein
MLDLPSLHIFASSPAAFMTNLSQCETEFDARSRPFGFSNSRDLRFPRLHGFENGAGKPVKARFRGNTALIHRAQTLTSGCGIRPYSLGVHGLFDAILTCRRKPHRLWSIREDRTSVVFWRREASSVLSSARPGRHRDDHLVTRRTYSSGIFLDILGLFPTLGHARLQCRDDRSAQWRWTVPRFGPARWSRQRFSERRRSG